MPRVPGFQGFYISYSYPVEYVMFVQRMLLVQIEKHVSVTQIDSRTPISFLKTYLSTVSWSKETQA